jgi:hypothetical protein
VGTYQPTIYHIMNVLTCGTIQMLPHGVLNVVAWQYLMLPCGNIHMVPHVNIK